MANRMTNKDTILLSSTLISFETIGAVKRSFIRKKPVITPTTYSNIRPISVLISVLSIVKKMVSCAYYHSEHKKHQ
jgi:hypothetical protein